MTTRDRAQANAPDPRAARYAARFAQAGVRIVPSPPPRMTVVLGGEQERPSLPPPSESNPR